MYRSANLLQKKAKISPPATSIVQCTRVISSMFIMYIRQIRGRTVSHLQPKVKHSMVMTVSDPVCPEQKKSRVLSQGTVSEKKPGLCHTRLSGKGNSITSYLSKRLRSQWSQQEKTSWRQVQVQYSSTSRPQMSVQLPKDKHDYYPKIHHDLSQTNDHVIVAIVVEALIERRGELMPCIIEADGGLDLVEEAVEQKTHGDDSKEDEPKEDAGFYAAHLEHSVHCCLLRDNSDYKVGSTQTIRRIKDRSGFFKNASPTLSQLLQCQLLDSDILLLCKRLYFILLLISMLKYQSPAHQRHTHSSPQIDSMFLMAKLTATAQNQQPNEQDQIHSIRNLGRYLFEEEEESQLTFQGRGNLNSTLNPKTKNGGKRLDLYERGQVSQRIKLQKKVTSHKNQTKRIQDMVNTSKKPILNTSRQNISHQTTAPTHLQLQKRKQSYMIKQVLKKRIQEEEELFKVKQKEKMLNNSKTHLQLNQTMKSNYLHTKQLGHVKKKTTATKEELARIFDDVNKRGDELKKRKEQKIQKHQEQKYQKQMEGVTFYPELKSSTSLRKNCTKGFIARLKEDQQNRERDKIEILTTVLRQDPFEPKLNHHRNSLSKSKIDSFRYQDSIFFTNRSKPELDFQKNISRFIYPEEQSRSLTESKANQSLEIPINTKDLKFLFQ